MGTKKIVFDYYGVIYNPEKKEVDKEVLDIISFLYEKEFNLYLFTNSSLNSINKGDKKTPFLKYFKDVICCSEYTKPHPKSFERLFDLLKSEASEIVLIDDSLEVVKEGKEYGINTVKFTDAIVLKKELEKFLKLN